MYVPRYNLRSPILIFVVQAQILCITKTSLFKYTGNFTTKKWKFSDKNSDIFHISAKTIDCGYSLEPPRRGGSNEYPQSMFLSRNRKIMYWYCFLISHKHNIYCGDLLDEHPQCMFWWRNKKKQHYVDTHPPPPLIWNYGCYMWNVYSRFTTLHVRLSILWGAFAMLSSYGHRNNCCTIYGTLKDKQPGTKSISVEIWTYFCCFFLWYVCTGCL